MICFDGTVFVPHSVPGWYKVLKNGTTSKYSEYIVLVLNQNFKAMVFLTEKTTQMRKEELQNAITLGLAISVCDIVIHIIV